MTNPEIYVSADQRHSYVAYTPEASLLPPFEGVRLKIARGRLHLSEVSRLLETFSQDSRPVWKHHWEPQYEHMQAWWLSWSIPPPIMLSAAVGDTVHNLRSALDILLCDIARKRGRGLTDVKFPFAEDAKSWKSALESPSLKRLGPDVVTALSTLGAYRNGPSSGLRALHDLDIQDKHRLVVPSFAGTWATLPKEFSEMLPPNRHHGVLTMITDADTFMIRKGLELTLLPRPASSPVALFPYGIPQIASIAGEPVLVVLNEMAEYSEKLCEAFITQFS